MGILYSDKKKNFTSKLVIAAFLLISSFIVLSFCATDNRSKEVVKIGDVTITSSATSEYITYTGLIESEGFATLKKVYNIRKQKNNIQVSTLNINSKGGNALVALNMAEWLLIEELNVLVSRRCYSACANFVFVAGKNKILLAHSKLIWHGSATDMRGTEVGLVRGIKARVSKHDDDDELLLVFDELFQKNYMKIKEKFPTVTREEYTSHFISMLRKDEINVNGIELNKASLDKVMAFYAKINVDPMIGNYGFDQIEDMTNIRGIEFYYSLKDLEKMGVKNITLRDGVWEPVYNNDVFKVDSKHIKTIF
jgi:ATP-dependent protease ClpP protease subunit